MIMRSNPEVLYTRNVFSNSYSKSFWAWKSKEIQSVNWVHCDSAYRYGEYRMSRIFVGEPELMKEFKTYLYNSNFGKTEKFFSKVFPFYG
jgi:hypothetical protein